MWKRFPIPEFNRDELKGMAWKAPTFLSQEELDGLIERRESGDSSVYGCYPVMPSEGFFARFDVRGDRRHAVMCVLPDKEVRIVGRSWAWAIQRACIIDSLDPGSAKIIAEWKTPRPMNTRLGPEEGMSHSGGVVYVILGHGYGDHWIANRTIADNEWDDAAEHHGFRVLSSSVEDSANFHDCNLSFQWNA